MEVDKIVLRVFFSEKLKFNENLFSRQIYHLVDAKAKKDEYKKDDVHFYTLYDTYDPMNVVIWEIENPEFPAVYTLAWKWPKQG